MAAIRTELIVKLVHQFLREENFERTSHKLENEASFFFDVEYFEDILKKKDWRAVDDYLHGFITAESADHILAKLKSIPNVSDVDTKNEETKLLHEMKGFLQQKLRKKLMYPKYEKYLLRKLVGGSWRDVLWGRPREKPLESEEWSTFFDREGRVTGLATLKERIFYGGVAPNMREEVWAFLLGYYPYGSTKADRELLVLEKKSRYETLKDRWKKIRAEDGGRWETLKQNKSLITNDVVRTDTKISLFSGEDHNDTLCSILLTYSIYNYDLGYCQGMNELLAPIFFVMRDEIKSFWCFVSMMECLKHNYNLDEKGILWQVSAISKLVQLLDEELYDCIDQNNASNFHFCFRWILLHFKRQLDYEDTMRLWEVLWTQHHSEHFNLYVCVSLLIKYRKDIMNEQMDGAEVARFCNNVGVCTDFDIDETLRDAERLFHTADSKGVDLIQLAYKEKYPIEADEDEFEDEDFEDEDENGGT